MVRRGVEIVLYYGARAARRVQFGAFTTGSLAVIVAGNTVLLVRNLGRLSWGFPGGFSRRGESTRDNVARELREELGLDMVHLVNCGYAFQSRARHIDFIYGLRVEHQFVVAPHQAEIREVEWVRLDEASDRLDVDGRRCLRRALDQLTRHS